MRDRHRAGAGLPRETALAATIDACADIGTPPIEFVRVSRQVSKASPLIASIKYHQHACRYAAH